MADYRHVRVAVEDGIATITLARPPVNALNMQICLDLAAAFADLSDCGPQVKAVILTGEGRCFCAGKDIKCADAEPPGPRAAALAGAMGAVYDAELPVIAAVNGAAIGAGFRFVLFADIVLAAEQAVFSMPEINLGLNPSMSTLLRAFNQHQAREIAFTGRRYTAQDMHRMGLIADVLPAAELEGEARSLAGILAAKDPALMRSAKSVANEVERMFADFTTASRVI